MKMTEVSKATRQPTHYLLADLETAEIIEDGVFDSQEEAIKSFKEGIEEDDYSPINRVVIFKAIGHFKKTGYEFVPGNGSTTGTANIVQYR